MKNYLEDFRRELKNRNYSRNTVRIYTGHIRHFLEFSRKTDYEPEKRIAVFLEKEKHSNEQRRLAWSSIKLFYTLVLDKSCPYKIERIRTRKRLPDILTRNEVLEIMSCITNIKHRLIISLLYGSGLRVSEVCRIKVKDINFNDLSLKIRDSKGNKDRITIFSDKSSESLKQIRYQKGLKVLYN